MEFKGDSSHKIFFCLNVRFWIVSLEELEVAHFEPKGSPDINIATGETSQAITPFHFFDNSNFHH